MRSRRPSARSLFVLALTAGAFALLVSIAASHLHLAADDNDGCAVCAAFAGKLEGPSTYVPTVAVVSVVHPAGPAPVLQPAPPAPAHLRPPCCGPPPRT